MGGCRLGSGARVVEGTVAVVEAVVVGGGGVGGGGGGGAGAGAGAGAGGRGISPT